MKIGDIVRTKAAPHVVGEIKAERTNTSTHRGLGNKLVHNSASVFNVNGEWYQEHELELAILPEAWPELFDNEGELYEWVKENLLTMASYEEALANVKRLVEEDPTKPGFTGGFKKFRQTEEEPVDDVEGAALEVFLSHGYKFHEFERSAVPTVCRQCGLNRGTPGFKSLHINYHQIYWGDDEASAPEGQQLLADSLNVWLDASIEGAKEERRRAERGGRKWVVEKQIARIHAFEAVKIHIDEFLKAGAGVAQPPQSEEPPDEELKALRHVAEVAYTAEQNFEGDVKSMGKSMSATYALDDLHKLCTPAQILRLIRLAGAGTPPQQDSLWQELKRQLLEWENKVEQKANDTTKPHAARVTAMHRRRTILGVLEMMDDIADAAYFIAGSGLNLGEVEIPHHPAGLSDEVKPLTDVHTEAELAQAKEQYHCPTCGEEDPKKRGWRKRPDGSEQHCLDRWHDQPWVQVVVDAAVERNNEDLPGPEVDDDEGEDLPFPRGTLLSDREFLEQIKQRLTTVLESWPGDVYTLDQYDKLREEIRLIYIGIEGFLIQQEQEEAEDERVIREQLADYDTAQAIINEEGKVVGVVEPAPSIDDLPEELPGVDAVDFLSNLIDELGDLHKAGVNFMALQDDAGAGEAKQPEHGFVTGEGRWVTIANEDCHKTHYYGQEGWRPLNWEFHQHWVAGAGFKEQPQKSEQQKED